MSIMDNFLVGIIRMAKAITTAYEIRLPILPNMKLTKIGTWNTRATHRPIADGTYPNVETVVRLLFDMGDAKLGCSIYSPDCSAEAPASATSSTDS